MSSSTRLAEVIAEGIFRINNTEKVHRIVLESASGNVLGKCTEPELTRFLEKLIDSLMSKPTGGKF